MTALFKCFKCKAPRKFSSEKLNQMESTKVKPSESFIVYGTLLVMIDQLTPKSLTYISMSPLDDEVRT